MTAEETTRLRNEYLTAGRRYRDAVQPRSFVATTLSMAAPSIRPDFGQKRIEPVLARDPRPLPESLLAFARACQSWYGTSQPEGVLSASGVADPMDKPTPGPERRNACRGCGNDIEDGHRCPQPADRTAAMRAGLAEWEAKLAAALARQNPSNGELTAAQRAEIATAVSDATRWTAFYRERC